MICNFLYVEGVEIIPDYFLFGEYFGNFRKEQVSKVSVSKYWCCNA